MASLKSIKDAAQKREALISLIYSKIDGLLGGGPAGQLFCMEFPARPLNLHQYEYDTDSRNSVVAKPFAVSDIEFRLTDDLFNVSPIVQGPNGKKLSVVFNQLINNYVPKLKELHDFITDKTNVRDWLMAEVEDTVDGEPFKGSRMELCKRLYGLYLKAKAEWATEKSSEYDRRRTNDDLDGFADWLSRTATVKDQELNNLFNDAVVRGYYHEILTFLGFLNVCSSAEALEATKQNIRNSSRRSLDESMDVLPVQLQPNSWFKAAASNLSPKDLTMAADIVIAQYQAKLKEMAQLKDYLLQLESFGVSKADVDKAAAAVEAGKAAFQKAEADMVKNYGDSTVGLVKIYLNAQPGGLMAALSAKTKVTPTDANARRLGLDQIAQTTLDGITSSYQNNQAYLQAAQQLSELRTRAADSAAHDYQAEITRTRARIDTLQADMRFLARMAGGVLKPENQTDPGTDLPVLPSGQGDDDSDGMFMDVVISSSDDDSASSASGSAQSSSSSFKIGFILGSVGHQSSNSSASSSAESVAISDEFTIGFRVAKVGLDRGGWFNPSLFEMSSGFQRIAEGMHASPRTAGAPTETDATLSKKAVMDALANDTDPGAALQRLLTDRRGVPYMLPAYPVGFVIAKDITIKVKQSNSTSQLSKSLAEQSSSTAGGFLCFSASSASSSKSTAESSYHGEHNNYTYIRIPGPQILGWFLQLTPPDNSSRYEALTKELLDEMRVGITKALTTLAEGPPQGEQPPALPEKPPSDHT
jgi:hypothetical protein